MKQHQKEKEEQRHKWEQHQQAQKLEQEEQERIKKEQQKPKWHEEREEIRKIIKGERMSPLCLEQEEYINAILTEEKLGEGFFGVVYKGVDHEIGHSFAIKTINNDNLSSTDPDALAKAKLTFEKEQELCQLICNLDSFNLMHGTV
mmetsp:Transcript_14079/g.25506  ORF Transcript_14079/g.25506 Transcript_14079/m.25506 type:complete len:146 (-) Transcript_14079:1805-2242(-)